MGATFIYLLTAQDPNNFYSGTYAKHIWRNVVTDLLPSFGDLIDRMLENLPSNRPANTQEILKELSEIDLQLAASNNPQPLPHPQPSPTPPKQPTTTKRMSRPLQVLGISLSREKLIAILAGISILAVTLYLSLLYLNKN